LRFQANNSDTSTRSSRSRRGAAVIVSSIVLTVIGLLAFYWLVLPGSPKPLAAVVTVGGPGLKIANSMLPDLYGVAVDNKGGVYFSDGTGDSVMRIEADGSAKTIMSGLDTPSGLAFWRSGWFDKGELIVANTGEHTIVRIDIGTGSPTLVAGAPGQSGFADGDGDQARFNGAVGVAINKDGVIFVADTYNDSAFARSLAGASRGSVMGAAPRRGSTPLAESRSAWMDRCSSPTPAITRSVA
jgi:hypothetical protein